MDQVQRLWARILRRVEMPDEPDGCWVWNGYRNPTSRYGQLSLNVPEQRLLGMSRTVTAPRLVCTLTHGPCPEAMEVMHSCDNAPCCAPHHVSWGTTVENNRDAWERGRQKRGEQHHQAKYSDATIATLRRRVAAGEKAYAVAKDLGIDVSYAYKLTKSKYGMRTEDGAS